jgi:glycosyltransferase involved in cell wall biosynthesis
VLLVVQGALGPREPSRTHARRAVASPLFTVVMPSYNTARLVGSAIKSVLAQTCGDFELIVVDDGSTDDTAAQIRRFEADPRVRGVRRENGGPAAARNTGIERATGEYVSFLDSDDLWMPNYLEAMERALQEDLDAGLAYTDAWVFNDETRLILRGTAMSSVHPPHVPPTDHYELLERLVRGNFIFSSATVRRSVVDRVGLFDTRLRATEDWEMWLRVVAAGFRAVRPPGLHAIYRWRRDSLSKDEIPLLTNERRVLQLVIAEYDVPDEIRAVARSRLRRLDSQLSPWGQRRTAARHRVGAVRKLIFGRRNWYDEAPPSEIASVLRNLGAL